MPVAVRAGVRPELVAQVRFATWTADHLVRQAAFLGLREDKPASEVTREISAPTPRSSRPQNPSSRIKDKTVRASHSSTAPPPEDVDDGKETPNARRVSQTAPSIAASALAHPPIRLTHPDKILDAASGLTKQTLADYYFAIAPWMLPHIAGRPLSIVRCPNGAAKPLLLPEARQTPRCRKASASRYGRG